jgi:hypothetical protein
VEDAPTAPEVPAFGRTSEVAVGELLGVSKQRIHQIASERGFPAPVAEDSRGRLWDRRKVTECAKSWRKESPGANYSVPEAMRPSVA